MVFFYAKYFVFRSAPVIESRRRELVAESLFSSRRRIVYTPRGEKGLETRGVSFCTNYQAAYSSRAFIGT